MEFGGRYLFGANRAQTWAALNNTDVLKSAVPGCRRIAWVSESALELEIKVDFGLIHLTFAGDLALSDVVPAERYTLSGKGRGGLVGLAHGAADIVLTDSDGGTELTFIAHGAADRGVMKLGKALIGRSAQKVIDGFFERIGAAMGVSVIPLAR